MGRHDAGRTSRGTPTRLGSDYSSSLDVEAVKSPTAASIVEPRLLRQVLWVAVAVTAGAFLLLLLSGGGTSWTRSNEDAQVLVTAGEEAASDAGPSSQLPDGAPPVKQPDKAAPEGSTTAPAPTPTKDPSKGAGAGVAAVSQPKLVALPSDWQWDAYHNHSSSTAFLQWLQHSFPHLVTVSVVGKSVQGLPIHALEITAADKAAQTYKPMFKWLGGMHGNEMPSVELLMRFAYYLASEYGKQDRVTKLLQSVRVQLLPCLNQDGRQAHTRTNQHHKDLNRNFPMDKFSYKPSLAADTNSIALHDWRESGYGPPEPETKVAMSWYDKNSPTFLSANVHGGALVANYPLDACDNMAMVAPCPTEEGDVPRYLAQVYSYNHPTMYLNKAENFENGTINGAVWYPVVGSLQDWVYHATQGMHLTMELHAHHTEPAAALPGMWDDNLKPLMRFTEMSHLGLLLWLVDNSTDTHLDASVRVLSPAKIRDPMPFKDHNGHPAWFKLMTPGVEYCLEVVPKAGSGNRKGLGEKKFPSVLVAAKLSTSAQDVIKGTTIQGLRIEHVVRVEPGTEKKTVAVGAATKAACKNV